MSPFNIFNDFQVSFVKKGLILITPNFKTKVTLEIVKNVQEFLHFMVPSNTYKYISTSNIFTLKSLYIYCLELGRKSTSHVHIYAFPPLVLSSILWPVWSII